MDFVKGFSKFCFWNNFSCLLVWISSLLSTRDILLLPFNQWQKQKGKRSKRNINKRRNVLFAVIIDSKQVHWSIYESCGVEYVDSLDVHNCMFTRRLDPYSSTRKLMIILIQWMHILTYLITPSDPLYLILVIFKYIKKFIF